MSLKYCFEQLDQATEIEDAPLADPTDVHAALKEQDVQSREETSDAVDDSANDAETLAEVDSLIEEQDGELSAESLLFASIVTDHISKRLGLNKELLVYPTTESYKLDDRVKVSTEQLDLAMEGLFDGIKAVFKHIRSSLNRSWRSTLASAMGQQKRLKSLLNKANAANTKQDAAPITVNFTRLHRDGKVPQNLAQFLNEYCDVTAKVLTDFGQNAERTYKDFIKLAHGTEFQNPDSFEHDLERFANQVPDPRKNIPKVAVEGPLPGGLRYFVDRKRDYHGSVKGAVKLDQFANLKYPARASEMYREKTKVGKETIRPLSVSEIKKLAEGLASCYAKIDKWQIASDLVFDGLTVPSPTSFVALAFAESPVISAVAQGSKLVHAGLASRKPGTETARAVKKRYKKEIATIRDAHRTLYKMRFYVHSDVAHALTIVGPSMLSLLKQSLKAHRS